MNQTERHFWECAEPPNGIYPTLDDYTVALKTMHQQQVTAPRVSPAQSAQRQVYGEYQVGGMSIRSIQASDYFEQIVTPAGKIAVFPGQRTQISSICVPNSMLFSDVLERGSILENINENAIYPPYGDTR